MCLPAIVVGERVKRWSEQHIEQVFLIQPNSNFPPFLKRWDWGEREREVWWRRRNLRFLRGRGNGGKQWKREGGGGNGGDRMFYFSFSSRNTRWKESSRSSNKKNSCSRLESWKRPLTGHCSIFWHDYRKALFVEPKIQFNKYFSSPQTQQQAVDALLLTQLCWKLLSVDLLFTFLCKRITHTNTNTNSSYWHS